MSEQELLSWDIEEPAPGSSCPACRGLLRDGNGWTRDPGSGGGPDEPWRPASPWRHIVCPTDGAP